MHESHRIAVLEDNPPLREELLDLLNDQDWQAVGFSRAADFMQAHRASAFDVLLLDLGLPDADGLEVAQQLSRQQDPIGIIILSARGSLDDRVRGLMDGADAYVGKPFEHAELLGYITALLRRKRRQQTEGAWCLQPSRMQLLSPEGRIAVALTVQEVRLINALAAEHPESLSRQQMIHALGEDYRLYDERRLEKLVSRLRQKLLEYCDDCPIKAVRGKGYIFAELIRSE
ncbi:response regulator transcription factor [Halopseudomonas salegens]|uniref:DNA-binding response regulator, OmpR family, contains REC and winged-helix (WHTH) domain n=1 Tax=Halopseudomonas salegens TaxID=1434072 RepID=A0A1H2E5W0_9GAMM|nr:response regulator transcription factor [Halopseudomonas salegens]SDT90425.1 DNA-binding response regulator, OmpR family, contains REC and winged-helix (wHTH) domain [Halopseudomonas salegens]